MAALPDGRARLGDPVSGLMEASLPVPAADEPIQAAGRILTSAHALLVLKVSGLDGLFRYHPTRADGIAALGGSV